MSRDSRKTIQRSNRQGYLEISCSACLRPYRICLSHVPEKASAFRCKNCGEMIRLPAKPAQAGSCEAVGRTVGFQPLPRFRLDLMTPGKRQPRRHFFQKLF